MIWSIYCVVAGQARLVELRIFRLVIVWIYIDFSYLIYFFLLAAAQIWPALWKGFLDFYNLGIEGDVIWNSFTLDRIQKTGELMRGRGLQSLYPPPTTINTTTMSLR